FFPASPTFDIILANINRNVLLEDIPHYEKRLKKGGYLLVSGFYRKDQEVIEQKAHQVRLINIASHSLADSPESWMCMVFQKI
ncbi:MAG: 50S ribosomal protein L11 methyltransferase, partial [Flammeovirgaceae bacterium]|nr:50S ribosomal protein L11 methyltransferase [Flammeovirgaceae bacterium]MDW8287086.1 50S ribosomal protein L11 methyltransferase [Flammeovirgaceae bacterium]